MAQLIQSSLASSDKCPHWSCNNRICQLSTDGLFLPVHTHIEVYCEGGHFSSCVMMEKTVHSKQVKALSANNRRRTHRVRSHYRVKFTEFGDGGIRDVEGQPAIVVDISRGGIRLESTAPLATGKTIFFAFQESSAAVLVEGRGEVKWCRTVGNDRLYHAGISFSKGELQRSANDRFGLFVN